MTSPRYRRRERVAWRRAADRVLVRGIGAADSDDHADLLGYAALVWVALDEPLDLAGLVAEFRDAGLDTSESAIAQACQDLTDTGWITVVPAKFDCGSGSDPS